MTSRENQAQFYWQSSAAGLFLGMCLGAVTGVAVAIYLSTGTSAEYASALLALPLLGVLIGAVCGGTAGIAGSVYASHLGRLPNLWVTAPVALAAAAAIGALFTAFSPMGWAHLAAIALPASIALGLALPKVSEKLRRPPSARRDQAE